jgi:hypothetical protein
MCFFSLHAGVVRWGGLVVVGRTWPVLLVTPGFVDSPR